MKNELDALHKDFVEGEGDEATAASEPLFYIQDARSIVGNCVLWWRPNGQGYTTELKDAGLYPAAKGRGLRDTDVMVPKEIAESLVVTHVRADSMREALSNLKKKVP